MTNIHYNMERNGVNMKKVNLEELVSNLEIPSNDMNVVYNKEIGEFISIMEDDVRRVENADNLEKLIETGSSANKLEVLISIYLRKNHFSLGKYNILICFY